VNKVKPSPQKKTKTRRYNSLTYPPELAYKRHQQLQKWKTKVKEKTQVTAIPGVSKQGTPAQGSSQSTPSAQERGTPVNNHDSG
jgi:hypothetical protein